MKRLLLKNMGNKKKKRGYIEFIKEISETDISEIKRKDLEYGGSWLKRQGVGAWMMACRKFDRLEEQIKRSNWDVFAAAEFDQRDEGVIDDLRDLRRYLCLIESEILARKSEKASGKPKNRLRLPPKRSYKASKSKKREMFLRPASEAL